MSLAEIKGKYDAIFSLGDLCLAALQLRKNNLRPFAGPLDWMSSPSLSDVNRLLRNRFTGFMDLPNLKPTGYSTGVDTKEQFLVVHDTAYNIVSSHDFKADQNSFEKLSTYPDVRKKLDRRIKRFLEMANKGKRILFIRTEGSLSEVSELESVLSQLVKNDFNILVVNHTNVNELIEKEWPIERVHVVELPNKEKWQENDHYWREIFDGISNK
ncbi:hypothetical protein BpJC7_24980 [Weizmannia acidilactici]|uniref:Papain-like cysteine peptidase n=1 Tax=Weizmannia acidilactici TaxID=2607726 RepID=A0A5J4JKH9_9BACI|nr:DUF1796 family putative cysteine peptidase [Weizmannia acidilactici]GER71195.1 hypothetical protein BpJC7_24980 [Weizmannia acidilactici]GER74838.1 hypothetical protein BpPP18_29050 [Weizmannia acidilactici]